MDIVLKPLSRKTNIIGTFFLCSGLLGLGSIGRDVFLASESGSWPKAVGHLVSFDLRNCKLQDQASLSLLYEFEVGGVIMTGSRYSFLGSSCMQTSIARDIGNGLGKPGQLMVAYNPDNPAQSTILTGSDDAHWLSGVIFFLVAILIGTMTLFFTADSKGRIHRRRCSRDE
ncbi:DUF3592 domain-containing protein [Massilia antarctica]|uniref:DUF3592 domain-containing protein n=1 Tax=Massilia antarctica TaxID=2765360 RepID=UPI0006BB8A6C|nr:DUF3592 domain-containing protein [Massilia sp. H27-R4]MCY0910621.1 DUF3592 domain-containing protein [Massilia sp. H27-R4]CUI09015.1 hypothetical protein BN2497_12807 [Janthinobacterium sp. CG23_2]CUU32801.1 hypothetical protein BN3177_12807 [Janthinobacterium sp. CG23_2]